MSTVRADDLNPLSAIKLAFNRTSPAITFVILVSLLSIFLSTAYHLTAIRPQEFMQTPGARQYENMLGRVTEMDAWERTQYYWMNNLKAACVSAAGSPFYLPLTSSLITGYYTGIAITYVSSIYGGDAGLSFSAQIFVHGIMELTGMYIIAAAGLRLGWHLWMMIGALSKNGRRNPVTKRVKISIFDFSALFLVGALMIAIAAPLEAYVSPSVGGLFIEEPLLPILFLAGVLAFYFILVRPGLRKMMELATRALKTLKRGEFAPEQLSIVTFFFFLLIGIIAQFR